MKRIAIVNYGMGNIDSLCRAIRDCRANPTVTDNPDDFYAADAIILPGVGAFGDGMANLHSKGLAEVLTRAVFDKEIPTLGICLGMQLLCETGTENGIAQGLGWIPGKVQRFVPTEQKERIPHVGWNEVYPTGECPLFKGIEPGKDFYFVHSYHFEAEPEYVRARTPYCGQFTSVVQRDNLFGVQFHPEKSQQVGAKLLENFLAW